MSTETESKSNPSLPSNSNIQTYHCICNTLLLATTHSLKTLPTRASPPSLDKAYILPLPLSASLAEICHEADNDNDNDDTPSRDEYGGYSKLYNYHDGKGKVIVVRREDGFEKRVNLSCTRCGLVFGYFVRNNDNSAGAGRNNGAVDADDDQSSDATTRKKETKTTASSILYILPGSLMDTESMKNGNLPDQSRIGWMQKT